MAVVLVTGANRGIGLAIAQSITARLPNYTVILGCRTLQSGQDAIERLQAGGIGLKLDVVEIDIESDSSIATAVAAIERKYGRLDGTHISIEFSEDHGNSRVADNRGWCQCSSTTLLSLTSRRRRATSPPRGLCPTRASTTASHPTPLSRAPSPRSCARARTRASSWFPAQGAAWAAQPPGRFDASLPSPSLPPWAAHVQETSLHREREKHTDEAHLAPSRRGRRLLHRQGWTQHAHAAPAGRRG